MKSVRTLILVVALGIPIQALGQQADGQKERNEIGLQYAADLAARQLEFKKYVAAFRLSHELDEDESLPILVDANGYFARDRKDDKIRFEEWGEYSDFDDDPQGRTQRRYRRLLRIPDHEYVQHGAGSQSMTRFVDLKRLEFKASKFPVYDPMLLVFSGYGELLLDDLVGAEVDQFFTVDGYLGAYPVPNSAALRVYWGYAPNGEPGNINYQAVSETFFDPAIDNMTTLIRRYSRLPPIPVPDDVRTIQPFQLTMIEWKKRAEHQWLPSKVERRAFQGDRARTKMHWRFDIEWWINEEVPDEVFTLEDIVRSEIGESKISLMVKQREEEKEAAKRNAKDSPK